MKKFMPVSIADFERIAHRLGPCELVRGEIIPMSPGYNEHSEVSATFTIILGNWARKSKLGRVFTNEAGIIVDKSLDTVRGADALYISYKRLPRRYKGFLRHAPELIVEVLGEEDTWKDLEDKVAEYHAIGVEQVWVAHPQTLSVRVYPLKGESFVLHEKDVITGGKLLPGFHCKVAEFFQD